jgi:hypothetical protein
MLSSFLSSNRGRYTFAGRMKGHSGAINYLAVSWSGKTLASGGK